MTSKLYKIYYDKSDKKIGVDIKNMTFLVRKKLKY